MWHLQPVLRKCISVKAVSKSSWWWERGDLHKTSRHLQTHHHDWDSSNKPVWNLIRSPEWKSSSNSASPLTDGAPLLLLLWSFIWNLKWLHLAAGHGMAMIPADWCCKKWSPKSLGSFEPSHRVTSYHHGNLHQLTNLCKGLLQFVSIYQELSWKDNPISPRLISLRSTAETSIHYVWAGWVWVHLSTIVRCWNSLPQFTKFQHRTIHYKSIQIGDFGLPRCVSILICCLKSCSTTVSNAVVWT